MSTPFQRWHRRFGVLAVIILLVSLIPAATWAQGPQPPPTPGATSPNQPLISAERVPDDAVNAVGSDEQLSPDATVTTEPDQAAAEVSPSVDAPAVSSSGISPAGIQGVVTLDVSTPDTIRAGEYITYTYAYLNTGGSTASGIVVEAIWTNFSTGVNGNWQFCPIPPDTPNGCDVLPGSVQGPAVSRVAPPVSGSSSMRFNVGNLAAGQSGQFSVRLRTKRDIFPKSNQQISRPAGSGRLFLNGAATPTSEDTANSMVIGPALVLTKTANTTVKIYPTETAEFTIKVGNATGTSDSPGGQLRADARAATNIIVKDTFPLGSEFVSATNNPVVDNTLKTVTWTFPGPLAPGQTLPEFKVTFRKLDVNTDCALLNNATYNVTSNEYPFNGAVRYTIGGPSAGVGVVTPLVIKSLVAVPTNVPYGGESQLTIVIQNFWNQPLAGIELQYQIQSNAYYLPGTANPAASAAPDGTQLGGLVKWIFNMPAGNKTTATETTFTLRVRGSYTGTVQSGTGRAQVLAPAGVPSACFKTRDGRVNLDPRLRLTKYTDVDPSTKLGNDYIVESGNEFPYIIDVTNNGTTNATNVNIIDAIPNQGGANFSYVVNSSTLDGQPRPPDTFTNGQGGSIAWNNLTIAAGDTIQIRYRLVVDGYDYQRYCNTATAVSDSESIFYGPRNVCVKINPDIVVTKTVDKANANPGEEVRFTLTLTNRETQAYQVGLFDRLGSFIFVRQESGYNQPQQTGTNLSWPIVNLQPGQQVSAVIVAKVPDVCTTRDYINEVLFHDPVGLVQPVPGVTVKVRVVCGQIEFSKAADRSIISLRDRIVYTLQIKNADSKVANNVPVEDILPQGFTYVGLDTGSTIRTEPQQQLGADGRIKLSWTIPSIAAGANANIKFIARSGDVVGTHENLLVVLVGGKCTGACKTYGTDGIIYSTHTVTVQPLITMEPKILETSCAKPGDTRTYQLLIVNTNNHDYNSTTVTVTLPLGLNFVRPLGSTPGSTTIRTSSGESLVVWNNLKVLAKPGNALASQMLLSIELKVGQVWGDLNTIVQTTSPDGAIPRKEGVSDPTVPVCSTEPAIAKDASRRGVRVGEEFLYQITLINPTGSDITASFEDQLPSGLSFVTQVKGPAPAVNGSMLTWENLSVPAAVDNKAGVVALLFKVRVAAGERGSKLVNTVKVNSSTAALDDSFKSVTVTIAQASFLPFVRR